MILPPSIQKPEGAFPDDPAPIKGFLNMISVFQTVPSGLYNWLAINCLQTPQLPDSMTTCYWNLSSEAFPTEGVPEPQLVDFSVTRNWLRIYLWHVAFKSYMENGWFMEQTLPLDVPVLAGKSIMSTITSVSPRSLEVHGVGLVSISVVVCLLGHLICH